MPKEDTSRRRLGLATAGAVAASALAATLALGANFGLFGFAGPTHRTATFTGTEQVEEQPAAAPVAPEVETRIVDVPVLLPAPEANAAASDDDETAATVPSVTVRSEEHAAPSDDSAPGADEVEQEQEHEDEDEPEVHDIEDHEDEVEVEDHADEPEDDD